MYPDQKLACELEEKIANKVTEIREHNEMMYNNEMSDRFYYTSGRRKQHQLHSSKLSKELEELTEYYDSLFTS